MRVSEIRVKQIRVNQGIGVILRLKKKWRPVSRSTTN